MIAFDPNTKFSLFRKYCNCIGSSTPFVESGSTYNPKYESLGNKEEIYFMSSNSGFFYKHLTFPKNTTP